MRRFRSASSRATCTPTTIRWPRIARTFLPELKDLFVQILLLAQEAGVLKLGTISLDGTKVHADARHSQGGQLPASAGVRGPAARARSRNCSRLSEQSEQPEVLDGLVVREEIGRREDRLARLAEAKVILDTRARSACGSRTGRV